MPLCVDRHDLIKPLINLLCFLWSILCIIIVPLKVWMNLYVTPVHTHGKPTRVLGYTGWWALAFKGQLDPNGYGATVSHSQLIADGSIVFTSYFLCCCSLCSQVKQVGAEVAHEQNKITACNLHYLNTNTVGVLWFYSLSRSQLQHTGHLLSCCVQESCHSL